MHNHSVAIYLVHATKSAYDPAAASWSDGKQGLDIAAIKEGIE
jgi:hypothetical protein